MLIDLKCFNLGVDASNHKEHAVTYISCSVSSLLRIPIGINQVWKKGRLRREKFRHWGNVPSSRKVLAKNDNSEDKLPTRILAPSALAPSAANLSRDAGGSDVATTRLVSHQYGAPPSWIRMATFGDTWSGLASQKLCINVIALPRLSVVQAQQHIFPTLVRHLRSLTLTFKFGAYPCGLGAPADPQIGVSLRGGNTDMVGFLDLQNVMSSKCSNENQVYE